MSRTGIFTGIGIFCLMFHFSDAQQSEVDSLRSIVKREKIKADYESAYGYESSLPDSALAHYNSGLKLAKEIKNDTLIAKGYNGIGRSYSNTGQYTKAIDFLFKALNLYDSRHMAAGTIGCLQSISIVYNEQGINDKALQYSMQALQLAQSINDTLRTGISMMIVGSTYYSQHNYNMALIYFQQALQKMEYANDTQGISEALNNVALIYEEKKDFDKALEYHLRGLKMAKDLKDKRGIAASYHNIAEVYKSLDKFPVAIQYYDSCIASAKEMDGKFYIKESYNSLSELYDSMGKYDLAYKTHLLFSQYKDTLLNEESKKQFAEMSTKYETEKKDNEINLLKKDDEIKSQKLKRQETMRNALIGGITVVLVFATVFFRQRNKISNEKTRSDELLLNILPAEVAEELKKTGRSQARTYSMATVMFADFKDFTTVSEKVSAELLVSEIDYCFSAFDNIIHKHGIEKIKTVGDSYLCAAGLPVLTFTHAADMVSAAIEIKNFILSRKKEKEAKGEIPFEIRIGIHTGPVVAGIVGVKKFAYDIWGDTVNIAARMESSGETGKVNISGATYELVKNTFNCVHRGKVEAKNKGQIDMYFVEGI